MTLISTIFAALFSLFGSGATVFEPGRLDTVDLKNPHEQTLFNEQSMMTPAQWGHCPGSGR